NTSTQSRPLHLYERFIVRFLNRGQGVGLAVLVAERLEEMMVRQDLQVMANCLVVDIEKVSKLFRVQRFFFQSHYDSRPRGSAPGSDEPPPEQSIVIVQRFSHGQSTVI